MKKWLTVRVEDDGTVKAAVVVSSDLVSDDSPVTVNTTVDVVLPPDLESLLKAQLDDKAPGVVRAVARSRFDKAKTLLATAKQPE